MVIYMDDKNIPSQEGLFVEMRGGISIGRHKMGEKKKKRVDNGGQSKEGRVSQKGKGKGKLELDKSTRLIKVIQSN